MNKAPLILMIGMMSGAAATASAETDSFHEEAVEALSQNAPDEFPEHGESHLIFPAAGGKLLFGMGGMVKGTASFDWGDPIDNGYAFATSAIPVDPVKGDGAKWQFSAQTSLLYLNVVALPGDKNQVGAYVNINFIGDNYCPALQYAYLRWRGVTVGYSYSLFTDQQASAPTIDYQGPNSFTGVQMALVNYEKSFGRSGHWRFGVGANMPMTSIDERERVTRQVNQRLPDIPAYIQYGSSDGSAHLRLTGILRNMYYRDEIRDRNIDQVGWGVKLSGMTPICDNLALMGQAVYGEGISSYFQDLTDCGADLAPIGESGVMAPVKAWGGYLGLDWSITARLHLSGAYSHIRLYPGKGELPDTESSYRYAQYAVGTVMYEFNDWLSGGMEYIYGRRVQSDGTQRHDSRLQAALQFSF